MTDAEIVQAVRAEIERLKEHNAKCGYPGQDEFADGNREGRNYICDKLLSFLKPFAEVDKHPKNILAPSKECEPGLREPLESEKPMNLNGLDEEVHSFFDECIEVYEVPLYGKVKEEVITADCYEITARHFAKWGAEHAREKMMAEAVEGEIFDDYDKDTCEHHLTILSTVPPGYEDGDKVRLIVLPKDERL